MKKLLLKNRIWVITGLIMCVLSCLPYFILRESSIVTYNDQLDGEIINYILNAKYMFKPMSIYPELMNGIVAAGVTVSAPIFIILYKLLPPFGAYLTMLIIVKLVGYIGTYLMIRELTNKKWLGFLIGVGFMMLPFYAVYGFCVAGEPMLLYAILRLRRDNVKPWLYWLLIGVYAAGSSLSLVGFAWMIFLAVVLVVALIRKKNRRNYLVAFIVCSAVYAIENYSLVARILGDGNGIVLHKSEAVRTAIPFMTAFWQAFGNGVDYTQVGQIYFFPAIALSFAMGALFRFAYKNKSKILDRELRYLVVALSINVGVSLFYAVYNFEPVVAMINGGSGILRELNAGRIVWIMPVVWIGMLGLSLSVLWDLFLSILEKGKTSIFAQMARFAIMIAYLIGVTVTVGFFAGNGFLKSDLRFNVLKLFNREYYMMTWEQFYAEDLFAEVDELIGLDKVDYRVVSYGIYPAAAAYNGYYCLDAYSNNYDVKYKHEFRKVIAAELEKSEYLREWYDDWGNRCYIVLAETMDYFTLEKRWIPTTNECNLNLEQLRSMGCRYMISASYIYNAEEMGMMLMNEEPIQTEDSWYRLWVYTF